MRESWIITLHDSLISFQLCCESQNRQALPTPQSLIPSPQSLCLPHTLRNLPNVIAVVPQPKDKAPNGVEVWRGGPGLVRKIKVGLVGPQIEAGEAHTAAFFEPFTTLGDGGHRLPGDFGTGSPVIFHAARHLRRQKGRFFC